MSLESTKFNTEKKYPTKVRVVSSDTERLAHLYHVKEDTLSRSSCVMTFNYSTISTSIIHSTSEDKKKTNQFNFVF